LNEIQGDCREKSAQVEKTDHFGHNTWSRRFPFMSGFRRDSSIGAPIRDNRQEISFCGDVHGWTAKIQPTNVLLPSEKPELLAQHPGRECA